MNLAKLGLVLDSKGKISRPCERLESVSRNVELADIIGQVLPGASMSAGTRMMSATTRGPSRSRRRRSTLLRPVRLKSNVSKSETPQQYQARVKRELDIVDLDQDITTMDLKTLRRHFGYANGKIKVGVFARNVIWQVVSFVEQGRPPVFVEKGGNVRSLWYYVKGLIRKHSRSFSVKDKLKGTFSSELSTMSSAGLVSYVDLNFIDVNRADRWVAPSYGSQNIILMAEKRAFSEEFVALGKEYGVTVQATGGQPSRVTVENMLLDMAASGHDLTKPFTVLAIVDFDPAGWNIASTFVEAMLELGLRKVRAFRPYGRTRPKQPWIDIVSVKDLSSEDLERYRHKLKIGKRAKKLADEWITATGGLYGRSGKNWALSSELFLGYMGDHLARKLPKYLTRSREDYQKIRNMEALVPSIKSLVATRLLDDY